MYILTNKLTKDIEADKSWKASSMPVVESLADVDHKVVYSNPNSGTKEFRCHIEARTIPPDG